LVAWTKSGGRAQDHETTLDRARRAASGLAALGVGAGDVVAVCLRNDIALIEANLAASLLAAYSTPVNWHNSAQEAAYVFENSGAKAIVIHADLYRALAGAIPAAAAVFVVETPPEVRVAYAIADEASQVPEDGLSWDAMIAANAPRREAPPPAPGAMIYTSGTTGKPKGVRHAPRTAAQAQGSLRSLELVFGVTPPYDEVVSVVTGPMYHSVPNGFGMSMYRVGANVILQPRFDPEGLLALIERERVSHMHLVPTMFVRLLRLPASVRDRYDLSPLRCIVHGAAPCPPHVKRAMIEWLGPIINEYYGGTETGAVTFCTSREWLDHPGTVGRALPGADVRIVDADDRDLPIGEVGAIVCRQKDAPAFTYHGDDEKRRRAERGGLIFIGDVGCLDKDGFLYLRDRANDMIISGGVNIYPAEIEAELVTAPGVADCAVFGIPDEEFGECVHAVVQPVPGAQPSEVELKAFLRDRIAAYKIPRRFEFSADLPREDSGKIFKRKLRQAYWSGADRNI
jgi:long-chain acyl-CoA synthetase